MSATKRALEVKETERVSAVARDMMRSLEPATQSIYLREEAARVQDANVTAVRERASLRIDACVRRAAMEMRAVDQSVLARHTGTSYRIERLRRVFGEGLFIVDVQVRLYGRSATDEEITRGVWVTLALPSEFEDAELARLDRAMIDDSDKGGYAALRAELIQIALACIGEPDAASHWGESTSDSYVGMEQRGASGVFVNRNVRAGLAAHEQWRYGLSTARHALGLVRTDVDPSRDVDAVIIPSGFLAAHPHVHRIYSPHAGDRDYPAYMQFARSRDPKRAASDEFEKRTFDQLAILESQDAPQIIDLPVHARR